MTARAQRPRTAGRRRRGHRMTARARGAGGPYPDARQALLIRAALSEGDAARAAWARFVASGARIEDLDDASFRLVPQLFRNLAACGVVDASTAQLRGVYRLAWYRNHVLLHGVAACVRALHDAGISVMALKGAAVAALYPGGIGTRPMHDVDLLVTPTDLDRSARVLRDLGLEQDGRLPLAVFRRTHHAVAFRRDDGLEIDLHWHAMAQLADDAGLWRRARPATLAGVELLVPSPADQLLHACVHGLGFCPAPVRWVTDAVLITRSGAAIDWDALVEHARQRDVCVAAADALAFLRDDVGAAIPLSAIDALERSPSSLTSRLAHRFATGTKAHGAAGVDFWDRYRRRARGDGRRPTPLGYASFVADFWGLPHRRALAVVLLGKAVAGVTRHAPAVRRRT